MGLRNSLSNADGNLVGGSDNDLNPGADYAIVVGRNNTTSKEMAFAMGYNNTSNFRNSWAIGGTANGGVASSINHQFNAQFINGYRIYSNQALTTGVYMLGGTSSWAGLSDRRLKKNITPLSYGLSDIMQLEAQQYQYKSSEITSYGIIAQDVQTIHPELVNTPATSNDYLTIRYTELIPVLTKAIQEQQAVIELLKSELSTTTEELNQLKAGNARLDQLEAEMMELKAMIKSQ